METRHKNRSVIQQLLWDPNDTTWVTHPVKERNLKIKSGFYNAIVNISDMDPKVSLPPILAILEEMRQLTNDEQNKKSISYVITYLSEANDMQHKDFTVALAEIQKNGLLSKMVPALEQLVTEIKSLKITTTLKSLTEELAIWLEGLYFHTLKKQQKGSWFQLPDPEDIGLKAATFGKVNKLIVATYYHQAALHLDDHLKKLTETNDENMGEDAKMISTTLLKSENKKENKPEKTFEKNIIRKEIMLQEVQNISLVDIKDKPVESKFPLLVLYIEINDLTNLQKRGMFKFKPEIKSTLAEYINDPWRIFKRAHAGLVQVASDDIENSEDPIYWINRLYQLWNALKNKKSNTAFEKVTLLLNTSCDILYTTSNMLINRPHQSN